MADEIAVAKCQSCENTQSKMLRIQLAVSGSNSKQNAETLKTYTQQNADETPEHGTPAVALMSFTAARQSGTAPGKCFANYFAADDNGSEEIDQPMHSWKGNALCH